MHSSQPKTNFKVNSCSFFKQCLDELKQQLFPHICAICSEKQVNGCEICLKCMELLNLHQNRCVHCALQEVTTPEQNSSNTTDWHSNLQQTCIHCQQNPQQWHHLICAFDYGSPISELITGFKYQNKLYNSKALASCLRQRLEQHYGSPASSETKDCHHWPEAVIPVPLHWTRQARRGFNQCLLLARDLKSANMPHLKQLSTPATAYSAKRQGFTQIRPDTSHNNFPKIETKLLLRHKRTAPQEGLSQQQRQRNLSGVFRVAAKCQPYKHIALLDDVVTTGATANNLCKILKSEGIERVDVWAVARTP